MAFDPFIALNRFGLGARPGDRERVGRDAQGWLLAQLEGSPPIPARLESLPSSREVITRARQARGQDRMAKRQMRKRMRQDYRKEAGAREAAAATSDAPFRERLVRFWSNHFTVSARKPLAAGLVGPFEREAIRPHVTGRFADMLLAVVRHPAMLVYLDNVQSVGPNSRAGRRRDRGLNENLAREILELHTLGVDGGYQQADVEALAAMLTGWGVDLAGRFGDGFHFFARRHEPGDKQFLGQRYRQGGIREAETALRVVAAKPATARHIARKLASHVVSDTPNEALVDLLARSYLDSGGDLGQLAATLVRAPEAWEPRPRKLKRPAELILSAVHATGLEATPDGLAEWCRRLGQPTFAAPSPAGWSDAAEDWAGPEALLQRLEWCAALAARARPGLAPSRLADAVMGQTLGSQSRQAVARAPSAAEGLALLLASPEFQRR